MSTCKSVFLQEERGVLSDQSYAVYEQCIARETFCGTCCNTYIREEFVEKRSTCSERCEEVITL